MLREFDPKIPADTIPSGAEPCNCKYINNAAGLLEISTWNKSKVSIKLITSFMIQIVRDIRDRCKPFDWTAGLARR